MKTENRLNHLMHVLLCLFTVGLWVPVYIIRLCANELHNRITRAYNAGYSEQANAQYGWAHAMQQNKVGPKVSVEGVPADWPDFPVLSRRIRELESQLTKCEFDKALIGTHLAQLVRATSSLPMAQTNEAIRNAHAEARKALAGFTEAQFVQNYNDKASKLRVLVEALDAMVGADGLIVEHPGRYELDELQKAHLYATA